MDYESSDVVSLAFGPLLQGQTMRAKLKTAYNSLIIGPSSLQCETDPQEILAYKSANVV